MHNTSEQVQASPRYRKPLIIASTIVAIYVILLFIPGIAPYAQYPLYLVKCGGMPIAASNFAAGYDYQRPGDAGYEITPFTNRYFCTEGEAQAAGYHPSP